MLADPQAEALSTRFAAQWLRLQDLDKVSPGLSAVSAVRRSLAAGFRRETELFFDSLVREDRSLLDLITADYSFVNERVALHYGIPERHRSAVPPRDAAGESPRHSRPRQHPGADVELRSHVAGVSRQVGDGSAARQPAAAAAAQCAGARRGQADRRRAHAVGARAHGGAPQEPDVQLVPPRHRSAGPGARELRPDRRVAHQGQRSGGRSRGHALRRHARSTVRRACARRCSSTRTRWSSASPRA